MYCARTHARSSQRTTRVFLITFKSNLSQSDEERERERERENELDVNQRLVTITITSNRNCLFVCAARVHVRTIESNKRARRGSFSFFSLCLFTRKDGTLKSSSQDNFFLPILLLSRQNQCALQTLRKQRHNERAWNKRCTALLQGREHVFARTLSNFEIDRRERERAFLRAGVEVADEIRRHQNPSSSSKVSNWIQ